MNQYNHLFFDKGLSQVLRNQEQAMLKGVNDIPEDRFLSNTDKQLLVYLSPRFKIGQSDSHGNDPRRIKG